MSRRSVPAPPLDRGSLERLALRYVERYATTRGKLVRYLENKVRMRGWEGAPPDLVALAERFASLGFVDDAAYAVSRVQSLQRRGLGAARARADLRTAGVTGDDAAAGLETGDAVAAAIALARRRRFGPFAAVRADAATQRKHLATMLRAGHPLALSRQILAMEPGTDLMQVELT